MKFSFWQKGTPDRPAITQDYPASERTTVGQYRTPRPRTQEDVARLGLERHPEHRFFIAAAPIPAVAFGIITEGDPVVPSFVLTISEARALAKALNDLATRAETWND